MTFQDVLILAVCLLSKALHAFHIWEATTTLKDITDNGLGTELFQSILEHKGRVIEEDVDWENAADELATSLSEKLAARSELVERVVTKLQESYKTFPSTVYGKPCCKAHVDESKYDQFFRKKIDETSICYDKYMYARNTMKHPDKAIKDIWEENLKQSRSIHVQFVGFANGISYRYPSYYSPVCGDYDPRVRPWYSAAMAFQKLMIIVVDMSTAMRNCKVDGKTCVDMIVSLLTVLLDTLTSNDHMALVSFDNTYHCPDEINGDDCYESQHAIGSRANKDALLQHIKNIKIPENAHSVYSAGIRGAMHYLRIVDTVKGKPIFVFLTGTTNTEDSVDPVIQAIQQMKEKVVSDLIFMTYFIGDAPAKEANILREMSNTAGRGAFTELKRSIDINQLVGDFHKPLALTLPKDSKPVLSQPYFDNEVELGVVLTMCKAVILDGELIGVAGLDVTLRSLLAEAVQFYKSKGSVVVTDNYGKTMIHPLLPLPMLPESEIIDIAINTLEPLQEVQEKVYNKMTKGLSGNVTIYAPIITSRGITKREGIAVEFKNLTYFYRKVKDTVFSVCIVAEVDDKVTVQKIADDVEGHDLAFTYHDAALQKKDTQFCKLFFQAVVKTSVVKFAPKSFLDPFHYENYEETADDVKQLEDIVRGDQANDKLVEGVVDEVQLTHYLDNLWRGSDIIATSAQGSSFYGWRYIGTVAGILRIYPGSNLSRNFDPNERSWFKRAFHFKTTITFPYLDALGAGYVITVSQLLFRGTTDKEFGVMGIDMPVHYFYHRMVEDLSECSDAEGFRCFIMDSTGYIIVHPDWFDGTWNIIAPTYYENIHFAKMEGDIAADMFDREYIVSKLCINVQQGIRVHFTEVVVDSAHHMDTEPHYEYEKIPDTNIYLFRKKVRKSNESKPGTKCNCDEVCVIDYSLYKWNCHCPCHDNIFLDNLCVGHFLSDDYSCTAQAPNVTNSAVSKEALQSLKPCFKQDCRAEKTKLECYSFISCRWCEKNKAGEAITPYCGDYDECYFGQVGHRSPYEDDDSSGHEGISHNHLMLSTLIILSRYI